MYIWYTPSSNSTTQDTPLSDQGDLLRQWKQNQLQLTLPQGQPFLIDVADPTHPDLIIGKKDVLHAITTYYF